MMMREEKVGSDDLEDRREWRFVRVRVGDGGRRVLW